MTSNLVWIDQSQGTTEQAAHIRAQAARDWRRRQREERSAAGTEQRSKGGKVLPRLTDTSIEGDGRLISKPKTNPDHGHEAAEGPYPAQSAHQASEGVELASMSVAVTRGSKQICPQPWVAFCQNALPMSIGRSDLPIVLMTNVFAEGYFTTDAYRIPAVATRHLTWLQARNRSMEEAIYAVGLLQIQSEQHNDDVAHRARRHYGLLLKSFQNDLETPEKDFTAVVAVILEVLLCQVYTTVAEDTVSWPMHVMWMVRLVKQSGTELLSSPIGHILYETSSCAFPHHPTAFQAERLVLDEHKIFPRAWWPAAVTIYCCKSTPTAPEGGSRSCFNWVFSSTYITGISTPGSRSKVYPLVRRVQQAKHTSSQRRVGHIRCQPRAIDDVKTALDSDPGLEESILLRERNFDDESRACANLLCRSMPFLLRSAGGNVSQSASVRLSIFFAQEFFGSSAEYKAELKWCTTAEKLLRDHFPAVHFDALLPWGFLALIWQPFEAPEILRSND
ncbi:hypothetical protein M409DRAFT_60995 [Zasmidium cellare ATCC 36951]|uniref:Transcription factor domain-containing protein n=1 Tax=Zasmidium cellare ATCC 36951 TaxID=1080233 RepID=A0A6A6BWF2_ZASCE|nr:uncharacterized protein M409DRAFT_60995 [Zasmidium cellare ATCC 36951]KAF2159164.1 hypothetical protein M409DRAFT_60995 [Zasmidium cellare ATCC 36951]